MAKDENGLNLAPETDSAEADDDVVDLLEVVKPGKAVSKKASDADEDFSADLESMLDTLSQAEQAKAAIGGTQTFSDPTPVEHEVDAHESLDMPGMDDFDDILHALGAPPSPSAANALDKQDEQDAPASAAPMPDLDAVPVAHTGAAATTPKTATVAAPVTPSATDPEEELPSELGPELNIDTHFSAPAAASVPIPATTPVELDGLPPGIEAGAPTAPTVTGADDAFFLDTAVGDIASESLDMESAPEPTVPAEAGAPMPDLDAVPVAHTGAAATTPKTATVAAPVTPSATDPEEELLSELGPELNINTHFSAPAAASAPIPATTPVELDGLPPGIEAGAPTATTVTGADDVFSLDTAVGDIASESLDMESAPEPTVPAEAGAPGGPPPDSFGEVDLNELDALLDDMLASAPASGPGPAVALVSEQEAAAPAASGDSTARPALREMEAKVEDVELTMHNLDSRIAALEKRQNELQANIDKLAAEAAAKIIREELAAILKAGI